MKSRWILKFVVPMVLWAAATAPAAQDLSSLLASPLLDPNQGLKEVQDYGARRMPPLPRVLNRQDWEQQSARMRQEAISRVLLAGRGTRWQAAASNAEWLDTLPGADYRIRKLRFEVLRGMWVPALLYEPAKSTGKRPGVLNFNGHDPAGKAAAHTQILCVNLARRGVTVLNVEWFGTGQLDQPGFAHGRLNQLDLVGTSGLTPFYLAMQRAIETLLTIPEVDPARVATVGFDAGGWQALMLGALDLRVALVASVSGYSSLHTALKHPEDLCHPEFLPYDLCTVGDYLHFTAMVAPRRLLLIYNAKDPLSFPSDRTLSPLANFAAAFYNLCGARSNLHWFINEQSTEHTFDQANRTSFYRELGRAIGANGPSWQDAELPCESELRTPEDLRVAMPATNETFHSLALRLSAKVPIEQDEPWRASRKVRWLAEQRSMLRDLVRAKDYTVEAEPLAVSEAGPTKLQSWRLRFGADWTTPRDWTVPLVELTRGTPKATALVIADQGRSSLAAPVEQMLSRGLRVLAADLTGFGEARFGRSDHLLALFIAALGDRPLGVQAGEVAAIARWAESKFQNGPVVVASHGPRTGLIALIAGSLEESAIGGIESHGAWTSLKQLISEDLSVEIAPEAFCPDLLERFDVPQLEGLILPRPVIRNPAK